jgi:hypothetical protein
MPVEASRLYQSGNLSFRQPMLAAVVSDLALGSKPQACCRGLLLPGLSGRPAG